MKFATSLMLGALLAAPPLAAQPFGYSMRGTRLVQVDLATGSAVEVALIPHPGGVAGPVDVSGLAVTSAGDLLAIDQNNGLLWRIDTAGSSSLIGPTGVVASLGAPGGLTQDACRTLWMVANRSLYTLDSTTGTATLVTSLAADVSALTSSGETLLGLSSSGPLVSIDTATGSVTPVGDSFPIIGTTQRGLDFDQQGRLWAVSWDNGPIFPSPPQVVEIDPATGAGLSQLLLPFSTPLGGNMAIVGPRGSCNTPVIPTASPLALAIFALLIVLLGFWSRRALASGRTRLASQAREAS